MQHYRDYDNDSNVSAYEYGDDLIIVKFKDDSRYTYTVLSAGSYNIEEMKKLADRGDGLNSFISKKRPRYATKN
jgi:hypothetical protein